MKRRAGKVLLCGKWEYTKAQFYFGRSNSTLVNLKFLEDISLVSFFLHVPPETTSRCRGATDGKEGKFHLTTIKQHNFSSFSSVWKTNEEMELICSKKAADRKERKKDEKC